MAKTPFMLAAIFSSFHPNSQPCYPELAHATIMVENSEKSAEFYKNIVCPKEIKTPWGAMLIDKESFVSVSNDDLIVK